MYKSFTLTALWPELRRLYEIIPNQHKISIYPIPRLIDEYNKIWAEPYCIYSMGFCWFGFTPLSALSLDCNHKFHSRCRYKLSFLESSNDGSISIAVEIDPVTSDTSFPVTSDTSFSLIVQEFDLGSPTLIDDIVQAINLSLVNI